MSGGGIDSELNLEAILEARWADPGVFSRAEFARAAEFYRQQRRADERLLAIRSRAASMIGEWTGREARDVGSFGLRVNLKHSDLDLGIGYPVDERDALISALDGHASFQGERVTRILSAKNDSRTTRLVFAFTVDGVEVELSVLTEEDFAVACRMLDDIETHMTEAERIAHTWVKQLLRSAGRLEDYAEWKLVTYARFCPEFDWVPLPEGR